MAIRYGCFLSYAQGEHGLINRFKNELADAIRCHLEPHLDHEQALFIDHEQLGGGDDIAARLALAMCQSVAMVLIYTPRYEMHDYTRREYAGMKLIEAERNHWYELPSRLIIPVIMTRHPMGLPSQITEGNSYVDFSHSMLGGTELRKNPDFLPAIEKIVDRIALHYEYQKMYAPSDHDCNQFVLPAVPPAWRTKADLSFPQK
jgi:hypothetical protein